MKTFQVITDSTSNISKELREQLDIDYLKMVYTIAGKNYDADLDWKEVSPSEYYDSMRKGNRSITGQVKISEIEEKFKKYLDMGLDVLYVACSGKLSSSVNTANAYATEILENYPGRKVVCLDSLRASQGEAMIAVAAAQLANEGKSIDEVVADITPRRLKFQTFATVETLEWLKKAGRVKASKAFFGNLFGVKPIIVTDAIGNNYGYKKIKGRKASLDELVNTVKLRIEDPANAVVYVEHADSEQDGKYVADKIKELVNPKEIKFGMLGPIIGATVGPGSIIVNFYGEEVTIVGEE